MKKVNIHFLETKIALFLVVVLSFTSIFQLGYSATPDPYIATTDADRISVASPLSKIYLDNSSTVVNIPSNVTVSKVVNLKPAITACKNTFIDSATPDNTANNQIVTDNKAIIASNNTLISNYRTNNTIVTATSLADLQSKITASPGNITLKITDLNIINDVTIGSATKSVTLIVTNFNVNKNNKTLYFYGNVIILNAINSNNNFLTMYVKKTSALTDGNLYIDTPINLITQTYFGIENMFYSSSNFVCTQQTTITSNKLIIAGVFTNNGYTSSFSANNMFYIGSDLTITQKTNLTSDSLFVGGSVINSAYNNTYAAIDYATFTITNTFYVANSITLNQKAVVTAKDLVVSCSVVNNADSSSFAITNSFYIANDLTLSQKAIISAYNLIIDGNSTNSLIGTSFNITNLFYIDNNFTLTQNATILSNAMFVGGTVTTSGLDQRFDITKDIFFGGLTLYNRATVKATNGDIIIEGALFLSSDISFQLGGRVAVGGNVSGTANTFVITAGGKTTSVIFSDEQIIQAPTPIPGGQVITVKQATVVQDTTSGNYILSITYKRAIGVVSEQIVINDSSGQLIKQVEINPAVTGIADSEGYVTIDNITFASTNEFVSIYIRGTFQQVTNGTSPTAKNEKPYFTTFTSERIGVPNATSTIYVDTSGHISMPNSITKVEVKFLKKAILDYGNYFDRLKFNQYAVCEKAATIYNDKTIEQIEAIIAGSTSTNIIIKTNKLNLTKDIKLGSATKSVTLIVDELTTTSQRIVEVFGNLVINKEFNSTQVITIKTYKANGAGGNLYTDNANFSSTTTLSVANMLYTNSLTLNQAGTINADTIVISGRLNVNYASQITAVNDIYTKFIIGNQPLTMTATNGDLVVKSTLRVNSTFTLTVGGRVSVGKNVTFSVTPTITAGRQKTALILPGEGVDYTIVSGDLISNIIKVNLDFGSNYTSTVNRIASFNTGLLYFAGDSIYYNINLPTDISNVKLTYSLNDSGNISLFDKFPNVNNYCVSISTNGVSVATLQTNANPVNLVVGPVSIADKTSSYIFKTKLSQIISAPNVYNSIGNILTVNYVNLDGINLTITKRFTTTIIAKPSLRLN